MGAKFLLLGAVRLYRWFLSPAMRLLFGTSGACRFSPTCSCYALEALERHGAIGGMRLTIRRLLRCHPWGAAGYDPVPSSLNCRHNPKRDRINRLGAGLGLGRGGAGGRND